MLLLRIIIPVPVSAAPPDTWPHGVLAFLKAKTAASSRAATRTGRPQRHKLEGRKHKIKTIESDGI